MWGVWIEWDGYNDGREKPAGRAWLNDNYDPVLYACEHDAIQRAAIWRTMKTERGWEGYLAEHLTIVQARRFAPTTKGEIRSCVPDLSGLTGFFR